MKRKDEFQFKLIMGHGLMTLRQLRKLGESFENKPVRVINTAKWKDLGTMPVRDALKKFK
jgi:hypothetical protein